MTPAPLAEGPPNEIDPGDCASRADGLLDSTNSSNRTAPPAAPQPTVTARRHRLPRTPIPWPYSVVIDRDDGRVAIFTRCSDRDHAAQTVARLRRVGIVGRIVKATL